jgi:hypothetical protein
VTLVTQVLSLTVTLSEVEGLCVLRGSAFSAALRCFLVSISFGVLFWLGLFGFVHLLVLIFPALELFALVLPSVAGGRSSGSAGVDQDQKPDDPSGDGEFDEKIFHGFKKGVRLK